MANQNKTKPAVKPDQAISQAAKLNDWVETKTAKVRQADSVETSKIARITTNFFGAMGS